MKKKSLIILGISVFVGFVFVLGYQFFKAQEKTKIMNSIQLEFKDISKIEYGSKMSSKDLIEFVDGDVNEPTIDTMIIGEQTLVYVVSKEGYSKEFEKTVQIEDTKKPNISLKKNNIVLEEGQKLNILDYMEKVDDEIDGALEYKEKVEKDSVNYYTYTDNVDINKAGKYKVDIIAVDKNANQTTQSMNVTVKEKKEEEQVTDKDKTTQSNKNPSKPISKGKVVCIDAGHQARGNSAKEPIGPGASQTKAKVTSGTTGVSTKKLESVVNLEVSLKLKSELESRGYKVIMVRTSQNVNISNKERAEIANNHNVAAFIRIHCNSLNDKSVHGALSMAPASNNKYVPSAIIQPSYKLSQSVINELCKATGAKNRGVSRTNEMSGINWCKVPVTIVEMGFMSNPAEDKKLADSAYQSKIVQGIANGIDKYLN